MWISLVGFTFATVALGWLMCGYLIWLRFNGRVRQHSNAAPAAGFPKLSIIVPCYNEQQFIVDKYRNLVASDYPTDRMEILFADGGSTDRTVRLIENETEADGRVRVLRCPLGGKINQLNHALPAMTGDVIVITDADARLDRNALRWIVAEFEADNNVALVGACTRPRGGLAVERCYWTAQNRVRLLESRASHVTIVTACCYAFRKDLLTEFPGDVIADDVYAAVFANTRGFHTTYSARATVEELRTPASLPEFFAHKFRKGNAVCREMLRFCYRIPEMNSRWKSIFTTCLVQQLLLPWITAIWIVLAATLANMKQLDLISLAVAGLVVAILCARKAVLSVEPPGEVERFGLMTVILAFSYTLGVLCVTSLSYVFFRQSSCYSRLQGQTNRLHDEEVVAHGASAIGIQL